MIRAILLSQTGFWTERTIPTLHRAFDVPVISAKAPFVWAEPIPPETSTLTGYDIVRFRLMAWDGDPAGTAIYMQELTRPVSTSPEKETPE